MLKLFDDKLGHYKPERVHLEMNRAQHISIQDHILSTSCMNAPSSVSSSIWLRFKSWAQLILLNGDRQPSSFPRKMVESAGSLIFVNLTSSKAWSISLAVDCAVVLVILDFNSLQNWSHHDVLYLYTDWKQKSMYHCHSIWQIQRHPLRDGTEACSRHSFVQHLQDPCRFGCRMLSWRCWYLLHSYHKHMKTIRAVVQRLQTAGFKLNPWNANGMSKQPTFLGICWHPSVSNWHPSMSNRMK